MQITTAMQNTLNSGAWEHRFLIHVEAKNRTTKGVEELNLWTGLDDLVVTVDGAVRNYMGTGQMIEMPDFEYEIGLSIKTQRLSVNILTPEIINMIKAYDSRLAPIQIHLAIFNDAMVFQGAAKVFDGVIDTIEITENDKEASCELGIVPGIRQGTKPVMLMKSDATQRLRDPNDEGFKYSSIAGKVKIQWGTGEGYQYPNWKPSGGGMVGRLVNPSNK